MGTYAYLMLVAYGMTLEQRYLNEAQTAVDTLFEDMAFTISNEVYTVHYNNPADFPITDLFGDAYGTSAAYKLYALTGQTKYLGYSHDFLNTLLRLTFWYEGESDVYSRDLDTAGLFYFHGGAWHTCPCETTESYVSIA